MSEPTSSSTDTPPPSAKRTGARWWAAAACAVVIMGWLVDFHLDTRQRDSFSWMDPYQYYTLATQYASGEIGFADFQIPTLFPIAAMSIMTFDESIPAALWMNGLFAIVLALAVIALCRELRLTTPPALAVLAVLCSPLLIGLSRELYLEFTLTALVALQYALWFRTREFTRLGWTILFMGLFALGLMWKMTWLVFFAGPALAQAALLLMRRRAMPLGLMIGAFVLPAAAAIGIQVSVFETSMEYIRSLGNTTIPIMELIGPARVAEPSSLMYYFVQLARTGLFLATPLIILGFLGIDRLRSLRNDESARQRLILWLWLITPLIVLILTPVKEPRHIAPCIVPAVLLMLAGIENIASAVRRRIALASLATLSVGSYVVITARLISFPYFLDRPLMLDAQLSAMRRNDPMIPTGLLDEHWGHARNIVISGYEPNEALALAWRLRPAAVIDVDLYGTRDALPGNRPFERYEDLFTLTAFNLYNRRCGWERYLHTLTRQQAVTHADFVLLKNTSPDFAAVTFPLHERVATIDVADGEVHVLRRRDPNSAPYRIIYGATYATRQAAMTDDERDVLFLDLYKAMQSRNPGLDMSMILNLPDAAGRPIFPPTYEPASPERDIYFYTFYPQLFMIYDQLAQQAQGE